MIFLGDFVFPGKYSDSLIDIRDEEFLREEKIVNFESLIIDNVLNEKKITNGVALNSSKEIFKFCNRLNIVAGTISNNHITDYDISIDEQKFLYKENNICAFGAGDSIGSAMEIFEYFEQGKKHIVLTFGWSVIGCKIAKLNKRGTNPLIYNHIIKQYNKIRSENSDAIIVIIFHWNYEFELYPLPAIRNLAHKLIDLGVNAIIGHHSHIVQGYEIYKNKPILYGLGNFYFRNDSFKGIAHWKNDSKVGIGIKFSSKPEDIIIYWLENKNGKLSIQKDEKLLVSEQLKEISPFIGLDKKKYNKLFYKIRIKRSFLPVYRNFANPIENSLKNFYNLLRQQTLYQIKKIIKRL